jgi:hypothetical protein
MRLSLPVERLLLIAGACSCLAFAACQPAVQIEALVITHSCTDDARTMRMEFFSNTPVHNFIYVTGTANVIADPAVRPNGNNTSDTFVVTDLTTGVKANDEVSMVFKFAADLHNPMVVQLGNVAFFKETSDLIDLNTVPDCTLAQTPQLQVLWQSGPTQVSAEKMSLANLTLQLSDPNPLPMSLLQFDLVHIPAPLDASALSEGNPALAALPWQPAAPVGAVLDPAGPPVSTPLPGDIVGGAVLCRFVSIYDGHEVNGIVQIDLSAPLATKLSTWGGVKSLFRD